MTKNHKKLCVGKASIALLVVLSFFLSVCPRSGYALPIGVQNNKNPKNEEAAQLLKKNKFDKVIELETKILNDNPNDLYAYYLLAAAYIGKREERKAVEIIEKVRKKDPQAAYDISLSIGKFFITKNNFYKALQYLTRASEINDKSPEAVKLMASINMQQGQMKKAKAFYEKLLASDEPDYLALSRIYLLEGKYADAVVYGKKTVAKDTGSSDGYLLLATAYMMSGNYDEAISNFERIKETSPLPNYNMGVIYLINKDFDRSLQSFNAALASAHNLKEAHAGIALVWQAKGDVKKAREAALKAIDLDKKDQVNHIFLGSLYLSEKKYIQADAEFKKAGDIFPEFNLPFFKSEKFFKSTSPESLSNFSIAVFLYQAGLHTQAFKAIEAVGQEGNPFFAIMKARITERAGDAKKAEEIYLKVIQSNENFVSAYLGLSALAESGNDREKALKYYRQAAAYAPQSAAINFGLAGIYYRQNIIDEAVKSYRKVIEVSPDTAVAYNHIAWILEEKNSDMNEALNFALKAVRIDAKNPEIKDTLGWIYYKTGKYDKALSTLSEALKNGVSNPIIHYHLGMTYLKLNKSINAIASFEKALSISEDFSGADEARKNIDSLQKNKK